MKPDLSRALSGYQFKQPALLEQALTHRSFSRNSNYERLEFLGDSVLSLVISRHIFLQMLDADEGELSRVRASLVKQDTLAKVARGIDLGEHLNLGGGELKSGGYRRASILSDTLEAIIGAIYLDSDFETTQKVVLYLFRDYLETVADAQSLKDPKTLLQEYLQARQIELPDYVVVQTNGKAHDQIFTVRCRVLALAVETTGKGSSRKKAEQIAADSALQQIAP